jgi:putative DNA primase/helicase
VQALADVRRAVKLEGPTSIDTLAIADSGERKTTVDGHFTNPIREWEAEQREAMAPLVKEYTSAFQSWEAKKSGVTTSIKEYAKADKDTILLEQKMMELEMSMPIAPRVPRLLYTDATPEALAYALAHKWPSGGVVSSEAGIVFGGHAMGKDSSMRNMALINSLWDGASITVDRKTGPSFILQGARLTMGLAVQPEAIKAFLDLSKGLARGIGFLARFLVAWPASTQGFREFQEPPENWPHLSKFHRRIGALLDHPPTINDQGGLEPVMLELSPAAKTAWVEFHNEVELELRPGRDMAETRDVASKTADNAARLAALFHVFENGLAGAICEDHLRRAAAIASWHLYEARRFMEEIAVPIEISNASKLDAWLIGYCRENRVTEINRRTIQQSGPNCIRSKEALNVAIETLVDSKRVRIVKSGKAKIVQINPALLNEVK